MYIYTQDDEPMENAYKPYKYPDYKASITEVSIHIGIILVER